MLKVWLCVGARDRACWVCWTEWHGACRGRARAVCSGTRQSRCPTNQHHSAIVRIPQRTVITVQHTAQPIVSQRVISPARKAIGMEDAQDDLGLLELEEEAELQSMVARVLDSKGREAADVLPRWKQIVSCRCASRVDAAARTPGTKAPLHVYRTVGNVQQLSHLICCLGCSHSSRPHGLRLRAP